MAGGAVERYLEAIYEIAASKETIRVKDIAALLSVSSPSVSEMVDKMVDGGLVTHDKYRDISLTGRGRSIARGLNRKHEVIKHFFVNVLEVDEQTADSDACEIEHVISDETLDRLVSFLESLPGKTP